MLSSLLDSIPYVESDDDRNARYPNPRKNFRVQYSDGTIKRFNGAAWIIMTATSQSLSRVSSQFLVGDSIANDRAALDTLVNVTMQPDGGEIDVVGIPRIASNVTIPKNIRLNFRNGAYLAPDVGATVTILGPITPTDAKIFGGPGTPANSISFAGNRKLRGVYAAWFGTQADDAADDTASLKACAFAVPVEGTKVFLQRGPMKISDRVDWRGGTQVLGDTLGGTLVKQYANKSAFHVSVALGSRNLRFADIQFVDAFVGVRTIGAGLDMDGATDAIVGVFERILTSGFMRGMYGNRLMTSTIRNCSFNGAIEDGLVLDGICTSTKIESSYANGNLRYGYSLTGGAAYIKFSNCAADGNGSDPYHLDDGLGGSGNITLDTCGAENNGGHGIYAKGIVRLNLINPQISHLTGALKDGIRLQNCTRVKIDGGLAFDTTGYGLNIVSGCAKIYEIELEYNTNALGAVNDPAGVLRSWDPEFVSLGVPSAAGVLTRGSLVVHLGDNIGFAGNIGAGEDDLLSIAVPAKTLFTRNQKIVLKGSGSVAANANNKMIRIRLGAQILFEIPLAAYNNVLWSFEITIHRNDNNSQFLSGWAGIGTLFFPVYGFNTLDLTTALTAKVTGTGVADNDIVQRVLSADVVT